METKANFKMRIITEMYQITGSLSQLTKTLRPHWQKERLKKENSHLFAITALFIYPKVAFWSLLPMSTETNH